MSNIRMTQNNILSINSLDNLRQALIDRFKYINGRSTQHEHNSYNFRSGDLVTTADVCYYGCSFTYGVGVELNSRWTNQIDRARGYSSNNFGVEAIGIDEILNIFTITSRFVDMKRAVFLLPAASRQTIAVPNNMYINALPMHDQLIQSPVAKHYASIWYQLPNEYFIDRAISSIQLIVRLAELQNISCIFATWDNEVFDILPAVKVPEVVGQKKEDPRGSDGLHPGVVWHTRLAQEVMKLL